MEIKEITNVNDKMSTTINFGKIAYSNPKFKRNEVEIEIELRHLDRGIELSICGNVWNTTCTDIVAGGQCLDSIAPYFKRNKLFNEILDFWHKYHLNGLRAYCPHQKDLYKKAINTPVWKIAWRLTDEARKEQDDLKKRIEEKLLAGEEVKLSLFERDIYKRKYFDYTYSVGSLDIVSPKVTYLGVSPVYARYVSNICSNKDGIEKHDLFYYRKTKETPFGLFGDICPICGHELGGAWTLERIPDEDLARIVEIIRANKANILDTL